MIKATVAIGKHYAEVAARLLQCIPDLVIIDEANSLYTQVNDDPLINGLSIKANFANYLTNVDENSPVIFCDADMFSLQNDPLATFQVAPDTDIAFVPYTGKWHFPDQVRQQAFDHFGYKINSGFMYFRTLQIAKDVCTAWAAAYMDRAASYGIATNINKNEYDEYSLMIALMGMNYKLELLDKKWNDWALETEEEIRNSESIFFQSHNFLDILDTPSS